MKKDKNKEARADKNKDAASKQAPQRVVKQAPPSGVKAVGGRNIRDGIIQPTPVAPLNTATPQVSAAPQVPVAPQSVSAPRSVNPVSNGAVLKPVAGGLQPIIAPKGQVQLQPVVVPVAFVPYATQNQPMLQYEKKERVAEKKSVDLLDQPRDNSIAPDARKRKKSQKYVAESDMAGSGEKCEVKGVWYGGLMLLILNILFLIPCILVKMKPDLTLMGASLADMSFPDIFGNLSVAFKKLGENIGWLIFFIGHIFAVINIVLSIVLIISRKNIKIWISQLIMFLIVLIGTALGFMAYSGMLPETFAKIFGGVSIGLPIGSGSGAWRLVLIALVAMIIALMFRGKKPKYKKAAKSEDIEEAIEE